MDERFSIVSKVPQNALKTIAAGRLRGKSDINPQWKIEAMTEVYGICGEGWYYEVAKEEEKEIGDGQVMLFMEVHLYFKTKDGEWSKPVVGMGGDFIIKQERNGMNFNDDAKKMCLTDALGNAMKCLGIANDVYRGFWDGAKYINERKPEPQNNTQGNENNYVKVVDGKTSVLAKNGNYIPIESMSLEQLNFIINDQRYASCHHEVYNLMASK